ncbi:flagellar hook protein FlgE [Cypionkella aquatica]|uniref:Flagellar hook protein FlgE n=1 Tax=Cypionkella aquatica TaxID=1756042 RepID=A0AA37TZU5_9RHOB|nr:flagellar hook-basal body complex protein [Cypionkella aquatica]GLS85210.1 flagellar hook protein FlgE [Cypionkella aquatica]
MTISSSLNAGVAGLNAIANRLATIADNIANSSTYGYRRAETDFHSVALQGNSSSAYVAGGVRTSNMRLIDERGPLISTANATDLAVDGRGFLPVTDIGSVDGADGAYPISLVTTGSFRPDASGVLRTDTGLVLMGWPANADGSVATFPRDTMAALEPVRINATQYIGNPTTAMTLGINLPATDSTAGSAGDPRDLTIEYFGNLGTSESLDFSFTPTVPTTGASNTWTMTIRDSASGGTVIGEYTLTFDPSQAAGGTLASVTAVSGGAYNGADGTIPISVAGGSIDLKIGELGQPNGMTQLSSNFAPVSISKNGSPVASLTSVEVDEKGDLYAIYDQGFSRRIYQLPVVDVPNPNGLTTLNNQTYQTSAASGPFYLWNAGDGPTGSVVGYAREESSTDVASELTQLIQTQRAYSSNAKVIQTADEMLQEATNIKR